MNFSFQAEIELEALSQQVSPQRLEQIKRFAAEAAYYQGKAVIGKSHVMTAVLRATNGENG